MWKSDQGWIELATYFITRHEGAVDWAKQSLPESIWREALDPEQIQPGDRVYGVLPVDLAARVCEKGARFYALVFDRDAWTRGTELTAAELERRGAHFVEYIVLRPEEI